MIFTSYEYLLFLGAVVAAYWLLRRKSWQNFLLLGCSYFFYGYVHPWFCILLAISTVTDYGCGLAIGRWPERKKLFLTATLMCNLGMLGFFKYFNFFAANVETVLRSMGWAVEPIALRIFLPVGISFYTFQSLSYTIDVYRGKMTPRKNFIDFALFAAFFPQLVAGPIERAVRLLPQFEKERRWNWETFCSAGPLIVGGFLKKMVVADNVAIYADKIFMLRSPSLLLLTAGTVAFAVQIYADFSGYTDIARGSARLLGFELIENFKSPYLAISPSDFWRRWHISLSSWIRDYLYIPLGGSRVSSQWKYGLVVLTTLGLSGLWHGANWNFIAWGVYHAALVFGYHLLGLGGHWSPQGKFKTVAAWTAMMFFTLVGWALFRSTNLGWLAEVFRHGLALGGSGDSLIVSSVVLASVAAYSLPLGAMMFLERVVPRRKLAHAVFFGLALAAIVAFSRDTQQDFIYFQF